MLKFFATLCAFVLCFLSVQGQNLPDEMSISVDDHILYTGKGPNSDLYDEAVIRDFYINFTQSNYWTLLTNNYQSHTDLAATLIVDGDTFPNVGVRFKGQTSYSMNQNSQKKSFNIAMDYSDSNQDLMGYETINLNNAFDDPSFMREVVFGNAIRRHVPGAKANYVHLYLNGADWGIYPNVQQVNGDLVKEWFFSGDGSRWRADVPPGAGGGGGGPQWGDGTAALNYLGTDTSEYQQYYTLKSSGLTNPWDDLVTTCDKLCNTPVAQLHTVIPQYLDLDRTLWFLASELAFSDDDSYIYKGKMDYYLYFDPETNRMTPLEFDGNSVMHTNAVNWGAFYHADNVNYPLLNRLLANTTIRQRYLAHLRTIISEELDTVAFNDRIDYYDSLINAEVSSDPKKIYTYNNYLTERTTLKNFIVSHRGVLLGNTEVQQVAPSIGTVSMTSAAGVWSNPEAGEVAQVTAQVTSTNGIGGVKLYYSAALYGNFTEIAMFDDGAHNDGAANDGVFGAFVPGFDGGTNVRFYIEAKGGNTAGSVSYKPVGAEHDVYYYQVAAIWADVRPIAINEVMASNSVTAADEAGEYDDWVELYNTSNATVDLSGWFLTDDESELLKWSFPTGTTLAAAEYMIVWTDDDGTQGPLHTGYKLSSSGESLILLDAAKNFVDTCFFGAQATDQGFARVPNGTGNFKIQEATFNGNNDNVPTVNVAANRAVNIFPNPTSGTLTIQIAAPNAAQPVVISDLHGRVLRTIAAQSSLTVDISTLPDGVYVIQCGGSATKLCVVH